MPSPFPGMDPYLEGSLWTTVHTELSSTVARKLAPKLRPKYLALPTERFVLDVPHVTVEIRDVKSRQLVTAIEILSPTNKRGDGRRDYLAKRRRVLLSTAHLLEIDLLHGGERLPMQQPLPPAPYYIVLSREEKRPVSEVWPLSLAVSGRSALGRRTSAKKHRWRRKTGRGSPLRGISSTSRGRRARS